MIWKFYQGFNQWMFDEFGDYTTDNIIFKSEQQMNLPGFIKQLEEGKPDDNTLHLTYYMQYNQDNYNSYWRQKLGGYFSIPTANYYIRQYINQKNLQSDYEQFIINNYYLFKIKKNRKQILDEMVFNAVAYLFQQTRYKYIYIYREYDHKGICCYNGDKFPQKKES